MQWPWLTQDGRGGQEQSHLVGNKDGSEAQDVGALPAHLGEDSREKSCHSWVMSIPSFSFHMNPMRQYCPTFLKRNLRLSRSLGFPVGSSMLCTDLCSPQVICWSFNPQCLQACLYLGVQFAEQVGHPWESRKDRQEVRAPGPSGLGRWKIDTALWCPFSGGSALLPALGFREGLCILPTSPLHSPSIEWICLPYKQRIAHRISLQGHLFAVGVTCQRPSDIPECTGSLFSLQLYSSYKCVLDAALVRVLQRNSTRRRSGARLEGARWQSVVWN